MSLIRAMSVGEIIDGAFAVYRQHFATLFGIGVVCVGPPTLLYFGTLAITPLTSLWTVLTVCAVLLYSVGSLIGTGATVWGVSEAFLGRKPELGSALRFAAGKAVRVLVAGLAKWLIIGIASMVAWVVVVLIIPVLGASVLSAFLVIAGAVAALWVMVFLAAGYAVVTPSVVLEELPHAPDALGRSWLLTKGAKRKAVGVGVIVMLLITAPVVATGALSALIPGMLLLWETIGTLGQVLLYPVFSCALTLLYYDLRVRKEAFDLEHLSRQLAITGAPRA